MAAKPRVALIGGGIGGLVAAIALRKRGFEPVVFEQASKLKEVGAGIQITPNSTKILREIGVEDAVRGHGFEPGFMLTRDMATGEILFRTQAKGVMAERFGASWFQIHRADLLEILTGVLDGADIRLNARCVGIERIDDGAIVEIDGGQRELFDVVVGCDGIHSTVRAIHRDLRILLERVERCFKWGLFDRDPLPHWGRGRVTLLGDAAHPMLPFLSRGAASAIEDGYVLARELAHAPLDPGSALAACEAERRPRTARIQLAARAHGEIFHLHSPWARFKRALRLDRFEKPRADLLSKDWIYSYDPTASYQ